MSILKIVTLGALLLAPLGTSVSKSAEPQGRPTAQVLDALPAFSWDTVSTALPPRKNPPFTDEDYSRLARHAIIGGGDGPALAAEVKKFNPNTIVVGYKNLVLHVQGTADRLFRDHPDWFLYDREGKPELNGKGVNKRPMYDLRKPEVREYWLNDVDKLLNNPLLNGVFLDAYAKVVMYGPVKQATRQDPPTDFIAGYHQMIAELVRRSAHINKIIIGNFLRADKEECAVPEVMRYLDGSYLEGFENPPPASRDSYEEYVAKGIDAVQRVAEAGKMIVLRLSALDDSDKKDEAGDAAGGTKRANTLSQGAYKNFEYKLAIFLTCAGRHSYFSYYTPAPAKTSEELAPDLAAFKRPLGPPKGPAIRTGFTYTREFRYASVWLDLTKREGRIIWKASYPEARKLAPGNNAVQVPPGVFQCKIEFDHPVRKGAGAISLYRMGDRNKLASVPVESDAVTEHGDTTFSIRFPVGLESNTGYSVTVDKGAFFDEHNMKFPGFPVLGEWKFSTR